MKVAVPAARPQPWYEGSWQASVSLTPGETLAQAHGDKRAKLTSESLTLSLTVDGEGAVSGKLGDQLEANGQVTEDALRLRIASDARAGTLIAHRADDALVGTLRMSQGDSATFWSAQVTLQKNDAP